VEQGADLAKDNVVRFRGVDLRDRIAGRLGVYLQERSLGKLPRKLDFRRLSVRSVHSKADLAAQENFKSFADQVGAVGAAGKSVDQDFLSAHAFVFGHSQLSRHRLAAHANRTLRSGRSSIGTRRRTCAQPAARAARFDPRQPHAVRTRLM
jgi:hypothetical protein